ncbi:MAG: hypothetical protein EOO66_19465 [Methylobacterium sp.]|nr:MAG: hypothetical protein EOO66_19465 [Methylobacterium sp.]
MLRTVSRRVFLGLSLAVLAVAPAPAQEAGGAPVNNLESAREFRNITATGVTKPPGRAGGGERPRESSEPTRQERSLDRKIGQGICTGCN